MGSRATRLRVLGSQHSNRRSMKLLTRNLAFGMHGADVHERQRDLVLLGLDLLSPGYHGGCFGETTRAAVQMLQ